MFSKPTFIREWASCSHDAARRIFRVSASHQERQTLCISEELIFISDSHRAKKSTL